MKKKYAKPKGLCPKPYSAKPKSLTNPCTPSLSNSKGTKHLHYCEPSTYKSRI